MKQVTVYECVIMKHAVHSFMLLKMRSGSAVTLYGAIFLDLNKAKSGSSVIFRQHNSLNINFL